MAKRNRSNEEEFSSGADETVHLEESTKEVVPVVDVLEQPVAEDPESVLDEFSDAELLAFMEKRRKAKAESVAIQTVNVPMYKLIQASAVSTDEMDAIKQEIAKLKRSRG